MHPYRWVHGFLVGIAVVTLSACTSSAATSTVAPPATPTSVATAIVTPTAPPASLATATVTPTVQPTTAPTAAAAPTAVSYGPVSVFSGNEDCAIDFGTVTAEGTGIQHARNGTAKCTDTVTD